MPEAELTPLLKARREIVFVQNELELIIACKALEAESGPIAIDAERASGFRYRQRAYLIQLDRKSVV